MASLFEMKEQLVAIDSLLEENINPETNELLSDTKVKLLEAIDGKLENILEYVSECKGKVEHLKSEEERLHGKRKSLENKIDWLKNLVFETMKEQGKQKAEFGSWNCSISKTQPKVIFSDDAEQLMPDNLCTITRTISKTAVKEAMVDGRFVISVDGNDIELAHLEQSDTLRIK